MNTTVIVFPGSNCDRDVVVALQAATGRPPTMVWHRETDLPPTDLIVLPGGFSYGDYLRCGAMAATSPIINAVKTRAEAGTPTLGICNGFQILTEVGLLPGALLRNRDVRFICRQVNIRVERNDTVFAAGYNNGQVLRIPVAHHDGNYFVDDATIDRLRDNGQVAFRYCARDGALTDTDNVNGSRANIAGVYNERGNVLGLMPHPERAADIAHGVTDGAPMFASLAARLAA